MEENESLKALTRALDFEKEGLKYFTEAKKKTAHPTAISMFSLLVEEETKHLGFITDLYTRLKAEDKWPADVTINIEKDFHLIFRDESAKIDDNIKISTDELKALDFALNMECRGRAMYHELSGKAKDLNEKGFYAILADWENGHAMLIENYYKYFEDKGTFTEE